jgi:hypothetical protein
MATPFADPPTEGSDGTMAASRLCHLCRDMCFKSNILRIDFVSGVEENIIGFPAFSGLRQESCLVGYSEDNQQGEGIAEHFVHHKTRKDLELSAKLGCHLCSLAANAKWNLYAEITLDDHDDSEEEQQDKKHDEEHCEAIVARPTPPNVFDWLHATITPFDSDYPGTPASERPESSFFIFNGEGTSNENTFEVVEPGHTEAVEIPGLEESQSVIRGKELKKLKSGILCEIFARHGHGSDYSMTFKEYVPFNNKSASGFSILRRPGEVNPIS